MTKLQQQLAEQFLHILEEEKLAGKKNGADFQEDLIIRFPRRFTMGAIIFLYC